MDGLTASDLAQTKLQEGIQMDTVITFDPVTGEEIVEVVKKIDSGNTITTVTIPKKLLRKTGIDTIITFDPNSYKKVITIINVDTGEVTSKMD